MKRPSEQILRFIQAYDPSGFINAYSNPGEEYAIYCRTCDVN